MSEYKSSRLISNPNKENSGTKIYNAKDIKKIAVINRTVRLNICIKYY